jgi:cell division protein FtsB
MNLVVRRIAFTVAFVLVGVYGYFTLSGPQGIPGVLEKRREIRRLQEQNANLVQEIEIKKERIRKMTLSKSEQDLEIRRKTQKVLPGDTEYMLRNPVKPEPESTPAATPE